MDGMSVCFIKLFICDLFFFSRVSGNARLILLGINKLADFDTLVNALSRKWRCW